MKLLLIFALVFYTLSILNFTITNRRKNDQIKTFIFLCYMFILLCHLANILYSNCHLLLGCTLAPPGSFITRGLIVDTSTFIRRMIEPSIVLIIFCHSYLISSTDKKTNLFLRISLLLIILTLFFESIILANPISLESDYSFLNYIHFLFPLSWSSAFLLAGYGIFKAKRASHITDRTFIMIILLYLFGILFGFLNLTGLSYSSISSKIAIHYYVWFPENWKAGYGEINPDSNSKPQLGEYLSDDVATINNHFEQFKKSKIDYVFLDWWPTKRSLRNRAKFFVKNIPKDSKVKFALHFETQEIDTNAHFLNINERSIHKLESYFVYLAKAFFNHPNYLTINGKKVVNIYITRHILGDFNLAIEKIRETVRRETGAELYLIGDEAFFNVVSGSNDKSQVLLHEYIPEWNRINALDAITLYNPYDPTNDYGKTPEEIQKNFLIRTNELYSEYYKIAVTAGKPFIPSVIPGYNDKAIRPNEDHLVIPRRIGGVNTLEFLKESALDTISRENYNLITITSWNEWNEGTNIEPNSESRDGFVDE